MLETFDFMHGTGLSDGDDGGRHLSQEQKNLHREVWKAGVAGRDFAEKESHY